MRRRLWEAGGNIPSSSLTQLPPPIPSSALSTSAASKASAVSSPSSTAAAAHLGVQVYDSPSLDGRVLGWLPRRAVVSEMEVLGRWVRHAKGWSPCAEWEDDVRRYRRLTLMPVRQVHTTNDPVTDKKL